MDLKTRYYQWRAAFYRWWANWIGVVLIVGVWLFAIVGYGIIIYVAVHFIRKFW
jgi:hypothetical protein